MRRQDRASGRGVGIGRRRGRTAGRLELAHARVEIDVQIALALLRLLELVSQHLDLPAQPRDVALDLLDAVEEIDQALAAQLLLERRDAVVELLLHLREALVRVGDALARLLVIEQRGVRRLRERSERERQSNPTHGHHTAHSPT